MGAVYVLPEGLPNEERWRTSQRTPYYFRYCRTINYNNEDNLAHIYYVAHILPWDELYFFLQKQRKINKLYYDIASTLLLFETF